MFSPIFEIFIRLHRLLERSSMYSPPFVKLYWGRPWPRTPGGGGDPSILDANYPPPPPTNCWLEAPWGGRGGEHWRGGSGRGEWGGSRRSLGGGGVRVGRIGVGEGVQVG